MRKVIFLALAFQLFSLLSIQGAGFAEYKKSTALQVFDQLIRTRGDYGRPRPELRFVEGDEELARIFGQTIFLGEKAYDVCVSMGADSLNALAFLLSHELIHYYQDHTWEEELSRNFASDQIKDNWLEDEVQADLMGGLLAYSSGYEVGKVISVFMPKLYDAYGKKDEDLSSYQPLVERVGLCHQTANKVNLLIRFFETANYLVALGLYEDAASYYLRIQQEGYRSREVSNNLGVFYTLSAMQLFRKTEMPYALPVELDAEARMNTKGNTEIADKEAHRIALLDQAIAYFEEASRQDPAYTVAVLNAGCAYFLKGAALAKTQPELAEEQYLQAQLFAKKAGRGVEKAQKRDALVLQGCIAAIQEENEDASAFWSKAEGMGSPLAKPNQEILEKGAYAVLVNRLSASSEKEKIEELSLDLYLRRPVFDTLVGIQIGQVQGQWGFDQMEGSHLFAHLVGPAHFAVMHITEAGYRGSTLLGISLGDTREKVQELYKDPDTVVALAQGAVLVYPAREILFRLDSDGRVKSWCVYRKVSSAPR